jgi:PEP-CTERM motif
MLKLIRMSLCALALALWAMTAPITAKADTIFNSFGPGQTYGSGGGNYPIGGVNSGLGAAGTSLAFDFTAAGTFDLTQIDAALTAGTGINTPQSITLALNVDDGGYPGSALESWTISNILAGGIYSVLSTSGIELQAGQLYWLTALPNSLTTSVGWYLNSLGAVGPGVFGPADGSSWSPLPGASSAPEAAFDVIGNPMVSTPEPSSVALLGMGLLALMCGFWRRQLQS